MTNGDTVSTTFQYTPGTLKPYSFPASFTSLKSLLFHGLSVLGNAVTGTELDSVVYHVYKPC